MAKPRESRSPAVLRYMRERPNMDIHITDISKDLGYPQSSVSGVLSRNAANPKSPIKNGHQKGYYLWSTAQITEDEKTGPMIFEEVGTTKDGSVIVRDEKGTLYRIGDIL